MTFSKIARYVRSRNLLADQLPQPFFLRELLLREAQQLLWSRAAQALRGGDAETMAPRWGWGGPGENGLEKHGQKPWV
jgi:hypothetical protein